MRRYNQFCPIAKAAEIFCERWTAILIRNLAAGATRFTEIHRGAPHMSTTMLSLRLKQLEAEGVLERRLSASGGSWTYHLTPAGEEFVPVIGALGVWGRRWTRRQLQPGELDLGLLIWGLEYSVEPGAFGAGRVVLELLVTDVPANKASYWFVNEPGSLDLCVSDPGYPVDLYVSGTLETLTHLYLGDVSVETAIDTGRLEATGTRRLVRRLGRWLNHGPLAAVEPAAAGPVGRLA